MRPLAAAVLLVGGMLAGCASPDAPPSARMPPAAAARPATARDAALASFNGWYVGRRIPTALAPTCREEERAVWFRVEDGLIELRTARHRRSATATPLLSGTVSADGRVAMRAADFDRQAGGLIQGGRLTATEVPGEAAAPQGRSFCGRSYEATLREPLRNRGGSRRSSPSED